VILGLARWPVSSRHGGIGHQNLITFLFEPA
jgi:hypothetical protein